VTAALRSVGYPVPRVIALCEDPSVLGAPFCIVERVEGQTFRTASDLVAVGPARARKITSRLVDVLIRLHAVDLDAAGLDRLGRPEGFLGRQLDRWRGQLERPGARRLPIAGELHSALVSRLPPDVPGRMLHGDFRLDNVLYAEDRPAAVVDWEMATVGDPFTDVALLAVYRWIGQLGVSEVLPDGGTAPGCLTGEEILDRYVAGAAREPADLGFYLGLAAYKLVAIVEGIRHRHQAGATVGRGFDDVGELAEPLLDFGRQALRGCR
jgi:aminoglycoside phosphotransferase (APT) family kinase protein